MKDEFNIIRDYPILYAGLTTDKIEILLRLTLPWYRGILLIQYNDVYIKKMSFFFLNHSASL